MQRMTEHSRAVEKVPQSAAWRAEEVICRPDPTLDRTCNAFHPSLVSKPVIEAMRTEPAIRLRRDCVASKFDL